MADYPGCRVPAVIGSGETSPTMVTVHRDLVSRLGLGSPQAIALAEGSFCAADAIRDITSCS